MAGKGLRLQDKVVVVTGARQGIGRAIALAFARQGSKLVVCADLSAESENTGSGKTTHEEIQSLYGADKAMFVTCDVTSEDAIANVVSVAVAVGGRLDIFVNNAGLFLEGALHEFSQKDWTHVMTVNATGTFNGCRLAIRQFLAQEEDENGERGCLVNIASAGALKGLFQCAAYCASKAAVTGLTREIAVEYGFRGIRANAICPGYTETSLLKPWLVDAQMQDRFLNAIPSGKFAQPEDITGAALWLSCSAESRYVNGTTVSVDAGFHIK